MADYRTKAGQTTPPYHPASENAKKGHFRASFSRGKLQNHALSPFKHLDPRKLVPFQMVKLSGLGFRLTDCLFANYSFLDESSEDKNCSLHSAPSVCRFVSLSFGCKLAEYFIIILYCQFFTLCNLARFCGSVDL